MKYQTKKVQIEALQWDGDWQPMRAWADNVSDGNGTVLRFYCNSANPDGALEICTLEGTMNVPLGDFVICGLAGEFYPCKPEIFHQKYEPASGG